MNFKLIREVGRTQRLDLLSALKRRGPMTVRELASLFQKSYMGIKQHCLDLEKEGYLDTWRRPSRVGRPEMLYRLTDRAKALFPGGHNALALDVLEAVQHSYGPAAPTKMLFGIFAQRSDQYSREVQGESVEERAHSLARLRVEEGFMTEVEKGEGGDDFSGMAGRPTLRIVEYHSPLEELLRRFPILARLEREMFERVLRCPVHREDASRPEFYRCTFHLGRPPGP